MSGKHREYIETVMNPLLEQIVTDLLKHKPADPVEHMILWLKQKRGLGANYSEKEELRIARQELALVKQQAPPGSEDENSQSSDEDDVLEDEAFSNPKHRVRAGVSAEVYGEWNKKEDFQPRVVPKSQELKERIRLILNSSFLFSSLEEQEKDIVIDAMEERKVESQEMVITQGDDGKELFVVETGKLKCFKRVGEEERFFKYYFPGESFGELALLYNAPRAACIQAVEYSLLLSLDRECFNHIVKDAAFRRRERYESILGKIDLFESMDPYERSQLADALKTEWFAQDIYVIKDGAEGDRFYIVEEGSAVATKAVRPGEEPAKLEEYGPGMYFGELALLRNEPRAANVVATSALKLISLDRHSFKRMLGPIEAILKRNMDRYEEILRTLR